MKSVTHVLFFSFLFYTCDSHNLSKMDTCDNCCNDDQSKFLRTNHEIICGVCGCFLEESMLDYTPDWVNHDKDHLSFDSNNSNSRCSPTEIILKKKGIHELFQEFASVIPELDANVWNDAKRMYDKMDNVKGGNRRTCAVACIYLAQRQMNSGTLSKTELCDAICVNGSEFSHALTALKVVLYDDVCFSYLIKKQNKIEDVLFRMMNQIPEIETSNFQKVKSVVFKLFDKIRCEKLLMGMPSEKVTASLIFIACKTLKIKFKLSAFCKINSTSCSSVFKIEQAVRDVFLQT